MGQEEHTPGFLLGIAMMAMMENVKQIPSAMASYKKACEEAGFSPEAAEHMAVDYHAMLMTQFAKGGAQ